MKNVTKNTQEKLIKIYDEMNDLSIREHNVMNDAAHNAETSAECTTKLNRALELKKKQLKAFEKMITIMEAHEMLFSDVADIVDSRD